MVDGSPKSDMRMMVPKKDPVLCILPGQSVMSCIHNDFSDGDNDDSDGDGDDDDDNGGDSDFTMVDYAQPL